MTRVVQIEPGPDAHLDRVGSVLDEIECRLGGHDIAADHLDVGILRLDLRDRLQHAARMAVRGVDHDDVDARFAQRRDALQGIGRRAHCRADAQASDAVLARIRKFGGLLKILDGDHAFQLMVAGDHQHLLDAVLVQQREHLHPWARSRAP